MPTIQTGVPSRSVLQGARHVLFVEGNQDGLDVTVLRELLKPSLRVEPLGPCFSIRSAAAALYPHHPEYWFIIDRDDWKEDAVEKSWKNFPDPTTNNLLIWRRKELESYFLEPSWACNSQYLKTDAEQGNLESWLANKADSILWLEAANRVIISLRYKIKQSEARLLKLQEVSGCTRSLVADKLVASSAVANLRKAVSTNLSDSAIRAAFDEECELLSGGTVPLTWGIGRWRNLMSAKSLFRAMVNEWFRVPNQRDGGQTRLSGRAAEKTVASDLLRYHQDKMPADFVELKRIFDEAI